MTSASAKPTRACTETIPVAWCTSARSSSRVTAAAENSSPVARVCRYSSSRVAASANDNASRRSPGDKVPGDSRYRSSTPTRMAPTRSGKANTAATPAPRAPAANAGQSRGAVAARSGWRTGRPDCEASTHGPSPRVNWRSSRVSAEPSVAATVPAGPRSVMSARPTPLTGRAPAHCCTSAEGSALPPGEPVQMSERISATRPDVMPTSTLCRRPRNRRLRPSPSAADGPVAGGPYLRGASADCVRGPRGAPPSVAGVAVHQVAEGDGGAERAGGEGDSGEHRHHVQASAPVAGLGVRRGPPPVVADDDADAAALDLGLHVEEGLGRVPRVLDAVGGGLAGGEHQVVDVLLGQIRRREERP